MDENELKAFEEIYSEIFFEIPTEEELELMEIILNPDPYLNQV